MAKTEHPYILGITGTISSGKSLVGKLLAERNVPVFDSDSIVHDLLRLETPTRKAVVERFGENIVDPERNGAIDRVRLGKVVFSDTTARKDLEAIVHPAVIKETRRRINELPENSIAAVLAPLLFEAGLQNEYNEIWAVTTDLETLKQRLRQRDNLSDSEVEKRLAAQWSQEKKASLSDAVIDNSGTPQNTAQQVDLLLEKIKHKLELERVQ
ncbi:MAG: dephospho-CoA kinase [Candidatus Melainabacteria bacterium]|nr:MAG: dephospho-CoA kinase [Candidatus Melainabacteria bacterium]